MLTAALPNVQRMFYTVNTVLLVKTVLGEVYSLMSTVPITKIEICLNFCTSLPRMKTSISAYFFCIKSSAVILQARLDSYPTYSFFNPNSHQFYHLHKHSAVTINFCFKVWVVFGSSFHLVQFVYETILSVVPLERGKRSVKWIEGTGQHQIVFPPVI